MTNSLEERENKHRSFTLNKKLVLLVMIVTVIALGITSYMNFDFANEILKERGGAQLYGESSIRGETLRSLFNTRIEQNEILSNEPIIKQLIIEMNQSTINDFENKKEKNRNEFLSQIQKFQELVGYSIGFEDVKIIGKNGNVVFSLIGDVDTNFEQNMYFLKGKTGSFIDFEPSSGGKKMIVVSPIYQSNTKNSDSVIGVIISKMRTNSIDSVLLNRSGLGETGEVYIVNENLQMLSDSRFFENAIFNQIVDTVAVQKCFDEEENHIGFYPDYRNVPIHGSSYCAKDLGFVLLAEIDEYETVHPAEILKNRIIITSLLITMLMGLVAFFASESLSFPLKKLKNAANKIANGDFDVRTQIQTTDEIGELSQAFDSMAEKLQDSLIEIKDKENVIKQQENILLQFSKYSEKYCVCLIDMINSTKLSANLSDTQTSEFYKFFLNSVAKIVSLYGGIVVKNIGDALLFYFPVNPIDESSTLKNSLNCCLKICESHKSMMTKIREMKLPIFDFRISSTYGMVRIAKMATSSVDDIFGSTVNRCSKINYTAPKNGLVIGNDFYESAKSFDDYEFKPVTEFPRDSINTYPSYIVTKK